MIAVIQARLTSSRFPGDFLKKVFNELHVIDLMNKEYPTPKRLVK